MGLAPQDMIRFVRRHHRVIIFILFVFLGMGARVERYHQRELWVDETNQIRNTVGPFKPLIWKRHGNGELTCFPGDYLLTYPFVQMFPENKWGMTIPHILSSLMGFWLLYLICQRWFKTVFADLIALTLYSFNFNLVFHGFEIRPYAVLPTLALAAFYVSDRIVNDYETLGPWHKVGIGIFAVLATAYHAYGILILFLCLSFFVLARTEEEPLLAVLKRIAPLLIPVSVLIVPVFLWYASYTLNVKLAQNNTFDFFPNPTVHLRNFLRTVMGNLIGFKKFGFKQLVNGIILAMLLPHKDRKKQLGFLLVLVVLPIMLKLVSDVRAGYWFLQRQFVWVMPLFGFYMAWCWESVIFFIKERRIVPALLKKFK